MDFKTKQRIMFWVVAAILLGLVASAIVSTWTSSESLWSQSRYSHVPSQAVIYSNGPYGLYRLPDHRYAGGLPTVNGKQYNVVYYRDGLTGILDKAYYYIPQHTLDTLQELPCADTPQNSLVFKCIDVRALPGAALVARVYQPWNIVIEYVVLVGGSLGGLFFVWMRYIRDAHIGH